MFAMIVFPSDPLSVGGEMSHPMVYAPKCAHVSKTLPVPAKGSIIKLPGLDYEKKGKEINSNCLIHFYSYHSNV